MHKNPSPTLGLLPVLALSTAAGLAAPAMAQNVLLDTIELQGQRGGAAANSYAIPTSTSDKLLTPLKDTPKTVKVITRKEIAERGQTSLSDILRATPGITLGTGENGQSPGVNPTIRGNSSSNDVMVDGFRSGLRAEFEAFNIESVEVSKGPGGAAAGPGATGGTINLGSKKPIIGETFNDATLSLGSGAFKRATVDMNHSTGDLGFRLNAMVQDANSLNGREGRTSDRFGIAPSISYKLNSSSTLTAGLYYMRDKDLVDYGVPLSTSATPLAFRRGAGTPQDPYLPVDVPTDAFYGNQARDFNDAKTTSAFLRFDHEFTPSLRWSTQLRVQDSDIEYYVSRPQSAAGNPNAVTLSGVGRDRQADDIAFNSQLTGETQIGGLTHRYALGIDVSNSDVSSRTPSATGPALSTPYDRPDPLQAWSGSYSYGPATQSEYRTRAIYLFDVVELAPKWEASFGLRYDKFTSQSTDGTGLVNANNSSFWNGSIGVVHKYSDALNLYASIGSSANPAGEPSGQGGTASTTLDALDPERAYSYEIGAKWSMFDDQLQLSAALFETKKNNARQTNQFGETDNIGKTRSRGFEFDVAGQINSKWGISAGYAYTDAKILDAGFTGCPAACVPSASNNSRVAGVPLHAVSLWSTYAVDDKLTLGGGAQFTGKRNLNAAGTVALPNQVRVDLMASYKVTDTATIRFNANNIFDEQLYSGNRGNGWANVEPGRNFAISLNTSF